MKPREAYEAYETYETSNMFQPVEAWWWNLTNSSAKMKDMPGHDWVSVGREFQLWSSQRVDELFEKATFWG